MQPQVAAALAAGGTVLASHPRLARALAAAHDRRQHEAGVRAWPRPLIVTLEGWLEQAWTARGDRLLLTSTQELLLWQSVIAAAPHADGRLDLEAIARSAATAWQLAHAWELDWSSPVWREAEETEAFADWATAFQRECSTHEWISAAELPRVGAAFPPSPGPVLLAGFESAPPAQTRLWARWQAAGLAVAALAAPYPPAEPKLVLSADAADELDRAAAWARALLDHGVSGPIGVIVPDMGAVLGRAERSFASALHPDHEPSPSARSAPRAFHVSLGRPLAFAPPVHAMLALLRAVESARQVVLADLLPWLRAPWFAASDSESGARAQLEHTLRQKHRLLWNWGDLGVQARASGCPHWATALDAVRAARQSWPVRQSHATWADALARVAHAAGWPGERSLASDEHQAVQAWETLLLDFAKLGEVAPLPITFSLARHRLESLAQRIFQPQAPDAPVQIMGWQEAAGAEFEHLWIAGLTDDAVPPSAGPHPFLPLALQREANMPRATSTLAAEHARLQWLRLLSSSPAVMASCAASRGDEILRPSPLLAGLASALAPLRLARPCAPAPVALLDDACAPAALGDEVQGPARILEEQSACPFRAFAHQRLHAAAAEPLDEGLPATARGELLHAMLDVVWSELSSHAALLAESVPALEAKLIAWAQSIVREFEPLQGTPGLAALEAQRLARTAMDWLKIERARDPFEVVAREDRVRLLFAGLELHLRSDRLDRTSAGELVLLDYKSGQMPAKPWKNGASEFPQLPLYAVTHPQRDKIAAVAFAQVRAGACKLIGAPTPPATLDAWGAELAALARAYIAGDARVAPRAFPETCRRCDLPPLCRVSESAARGEADEDQADGE